MADTTKIEWTDATWQIITGCSVVSPGCTNCYAMRLAGTRLRNHPSREGLTVETKAGPVWNGMVRFNVGWLKQPMQWAKPRMIFVAAHGDLFHEAVQDWMLVQIFAVMAITRRHTYQVLTKRADRMRKFVTWLGTKEGFAALEAACRKLGHTLTFEGAGLQPFPFPNVWLGVSAEDQPRADERIPHLLATPAAKRWISAEPLLGSIDLAMLCPGHYFVDALRGIKYHDSPEPSPTELTGRLDWVVVGGESGPGSRPMHPAWEHEIREQCAGDGVAYFRKQWGDWLPCKMDDPSDGSGWVIYPDDESIDLGDRKFKTMTAHGKEFFRMGKKRAGHLLNGVEHRAFPK